MADINIRLVKSLNGRHDKHIATAQSLGLRRIGDTTKQPNNPQTLGKLAQIGYLVEFAEEKPAPKKARRKQEDAT
jgi:large subunit ribosomal protein L30